MATKTKKKSFTFGKGLALYAAILLAIVLIALIVFYFFISAYEHTRPLTTLNRYLASLEERDVPELVPDLIGSINKNVQDPEESYRLILETLRSAKATKKVTESTDTSFVYILRDADKNQLGRFVLTPSGRHIFGLSAWELSEKEFSLDSLFNESEITVPADYQVLCNGQPLGSGNIVDSNTHYALLEEFYEDFDDLPCLVRYSSGKIIGDIELQVVTPEGKTISQDDLSEDLFTDNCTAEEREQIQAFLDAYIPRYVAYLSGADGIHLPNLYAVLEYTVPDSDLYSRLRQALGGQGFASSHGDFLQSLTMNHAMNLGNGKYLCDATYLVETYGQNGAVTTTTNNAKILLKQTDAGMLGMAQVSY